MMAIATIFFALILVGFLAKLQMRFSVPSPKVQLFQILWAAIGKGRHPDHPKNRENNMQSVTKKGLQTR
jgi:hypothetical protein